MMEWARDAGSAITPAKPLFRKGVVDSNVPAYPVADERFRSLVRGWMLLVPDTIGDARKSRGCVDLARQTTEASRDGVVLLTNQWAREEAKP